MEGMVFRRRLGGDGAREIWRSCRSTATGDRGERRRRWLHGVVSWCLLLPSPAVKREERGGRLGLVFTGQTLPETMVEADDKEGKGRGLRRGGEYERSGDVASPETVVVRRKRGKKREGGVGFPVVAGENEGEKMK
ncbi:hypothetical protein HAX54_006062 [Datura stramonium]|uniref:Uncharacterized protein n=1 Tax=Datura stramonium TaxID=4076 RepID=A0ABS8RUY8_DATST|nr:hypothetical protein [Datura stramonium]